LRGLPTEADLDRDLAQRAADLGRWDQALDLLARAAELEPERGEALLGHALGLDYAGRHQEALALLQAQEGRFAHDAVLQARIRFHQAHTRLLLGDLEGGLPLMESRLLLAAPRPLPLPRWRGESLAGRKILLRAEQGYGDLFMFVRYAPLLAAQGAEVFLESLFTAKGVLETCPGIAGVMEGAWSVPSDLLQVELLSLPLLCGTTLDSIPAPVPYLSVPAQVAHRQDLERAIQGPGRKLGLVWSGNPGHVRTHERNIPPEILEVLAEVPGVSWFSLQKGGPPPPALPLVDLEPLLGDYGDTAFALSLLDGLVSVDTGIVHLAGALGVPTWVMLPRLPDWRWMLERTDSPWYPTLTLCRQEAHWDWPGVVERLVRALSPAPPG
jgi:hypothetical protein